MWVIEPLQQLDGGAFPTATAAHKGYGLPTVHLETQAIQDLRTKYNTL